MYRVLIVDDEPWVAYGISKLINWGELNFSVIGEAHDGVTALQMIKQMKPEVVISDIRMPGLNGIELLKELRNCGMETSVIFISGYSEFQYAQQSIRLGAFDYLLKQVEREALADTLSRLKAKLDKQRDAQMKPDLLLDDLFELMDRDGTTSVGDFLAARGIQRSGNFRYRFINCEYLRATVSAQAPVVEEGGDFSAMGFRTGPSRISFLACSDAMGNVEPARDFIKVHAPTAHYTGVSPDYCSETAVSRLYQEADIALCSAVGLNRSRMVEYHKPICMQELSAEMLQLELAVKERRADDIRLRLHAIRDHCIRQGLLMDQVTNLYNRTLSLLQKYYGSEGNAAEGDYLTYLQAANQFVNYASLFARLQEMFEARSETGVILSDDSVKEIMDYIDARLTEDLVLGEVARHFSLSIGYLSTLIKRKTGITYSEYIIRGRIRKAKELLADPGLSIQEIVLLVGYKDYFHFNKLFKKYVGLTPSKFRKI